MDGQDAPAAVVTEVEFGQVGARVTDQLREAILSGALQPGERIRQSELAKEFGTSRIPVREALRRLEAEGLVDLVPNSGAWVAQLSVADAIEVYKIREQLEPLAIADSVPGLDDEQIREIHDLAEQMVGVTEIAEFMRLDRQFHMATYAAAKMPRLASLIDHYWNAAQHYRRVFLTGASEPDYEMVHADHHLLVDAIERRDQTAAQWVLRGHIRRTRLLLVAHGEEIPPSRH